MEVIQWINDLPVGTGILVTVGGGILLASLGTLIVNYYFTPGQLIVNNIIGGFKYAFLSSVYAGYIGLLLFGVYQKYDDVRSDIIMEVNALTSLDRVAAAFPQATRDEIRQELREYARQVSEVEWPQMRRRTLGFVASPTLDTIYYTYLAIEPQTEKELAAFQYSLQLLQVVRDNRGHRIRLSFGALTPLLWGVAIVGTTVSMIFPWFFGGPNVYAPVLMSALVGLVTMSVFLVILKLSYPFAGEYGIPPAAYIDFSRSSSG
ncbi:MAG: DUF4239 domain-containing protein [Proteobacteria bacterium]|nr:DUF4239 domain-containing protein [Pseudomonadota bacterium]